MSRRTTVNLNLKMDGFSLTAVRESRIVDSVDPTEMIRWTSNRFELEQFFGDVSGTVDGGRVEPGDQIGMELYGWLEAIHSLKQTFEAMDESDVPDIRVEA